VKSCVEIKSEVAVDYFLRAMAQGSSVPHQQQLDCMHAEDAPSEKAWRRSGPCSTFWRHSNPVASNVEPFPRKTLVLFWKRGFTVALRYQPRRRFDFVLFVLLVKERSELQVCGCDSPHCNRTSRFDSDLVVENGTSRAAQARKPKKMAAIRSCAQGRTSQSALTTY